MSKLRKRPIADDFSIGMQQKKLEEDPGNETALDLIDFYQNFEKIKAQKEETEEWRKDNLEYDLRITDWVADKCKDVSYAQNLYAALCNNEFIRNEVWAILSDGPKWSCSWRYAGGIIADIRQEGDYIDWYCSGIRNTGDDGESIDTRYIQRQYVSESTVTDEIRTDLLKLGWKVCLDDIGYDG